MCSYTAPRSAGVASRRIQTNFWNPQSKASTGIGFPRYRKDVTASKFRICFSFYPLSFQQLRYFRLRLVRLPALLLGISRTCGGSSGNPVGRGRPPGGRRRARFMSPERRLIFARKGARPSPPAAGRLDLMMPTSAKNAAGNGRYNNLLRFAARAPRTAPPTVHRPKGVGPRAAAFCFWRLGCAAGGNPKAR